MNKILYAFLEISALEAKLSFKKMCWLCRDKLWPYSEMCGISQGNDHMLEVSPISQGCFRSLLHFKCVSCVSSVLKVPFKTKMWLCWHLLRANEAWFISVEIEIKNTWVLFPTLFVCSCILIFRTHGKSDGAEAVWFFFPVFPVFQWVAGLSKRMQWINVSTSEAVSVQVYFFY